MYPTLSGRQPISRVTTSFPPINKYYALSPTSCDQGVKSHKNLDLTFLRMGRLYNELNCFSARANSCYFENDD